MSEFCQYLCFRVFAVQILFVLAACAPQPTITPTSTLAATQIPTAAATVAVTPQPTATIPLPAPTPTSLAVCNFLDPPCTFEGRSLLHRPIALPGNLLMDPSYAFGTTQLEARVPHHGVEFQNPLGTPVLAAADGEVMVAGDDRIVFYSPWQGMYGNLVVVAHDLPGVDGTVYTLYAHLSEVDVSVGEQVVAGDQIGRVGLSGAAIGSHLHFEVRLGRNSYSSNRNPALWLEPAPGADGELLGTLAGRVVDAAGRPVHVEMRVQYFFERGGPQVNGFQAETYASETFPVKGDDAWRENFAIGDLPPGWYRITIANGAVVEAWAEVVPGKVTMVLIELE
ncbi:MAG: peptidoglycan DD-metalloendopeptidase family protein [Chloroflexota bacterium]